MMECDEVPDLGPLANVLSEAQDEWLDGIRQVKRLVIGSNRQKTKVIDNGIIPRLLEWMTKETLLQDLRTEAAVVLGSLTWGTADNINSVVLHGAVKILIRGVFNSDLRYVEACLRCLRTIFNAPNPPVDEIYEEPAFIPHLLHIICQSVDTRECIANILANSCKCKVHQDILCNVDAISRLAPLLLSGTRSYKVQMPVLKFFAAFCYQNPEVCKKVVGATVNGVPVPKLIGELQSRNKTSEMQMAAAKCLTYLHRGGAIPSSDDIIFLETLPTLVRMCKKDRTLLENVEGAETLSYLIMEDQNLQKIASICDQSMLALAEYLKYTEIQQLDSRQTQKTDVDLTNSLKAASFSAFAALGANDEQIRKNIVKMKEVTGGIVAGLASSDLKVQTAACRCLHSLSRSVQLIRTTFIDNGVWKPVTELMKSDSVELLKIASSTLCNLLLEFSSCKDAVIECGAIETLVTLCKREDEHALRLNGVWGLMNLSFNSDQFVKMQVVEHMKLDILQSLMKEGNSDILLRTLGLLRNLMTRKQQIDNVMGAYGTGTLDSLANILSGDYSVDIKEQALCVFANIADGKDSKKTLLEHAQTINKILEILQGEGEIRLQRAAVCFITNLLAGDDVNFRVQQIRELGVHEMLQKLLQSTDAHLQERVKQALMLFH